MTVAPAAILADPTLVPTDLTVEQAETLLTDTAAVLFPTTFGIPEWVAFGDVMAAFAPVLGDSEVLYTIARYWGDHRPPSAMPTKAVVAAFRETLTKRNLLVPDDTPTDPALIQRSTDLFRASDDIVHGRVEDFTPPADERYATDLAAYITFAPVPAAHVTTVDETLAVIETAHPTPTITALRRLATAMHTRRASA